MDSSADRTNMGGVYALKMFLSCPVDINFHPLKDGKALFPA